MKILITGARGLVGSHLAQHFVTDHDVTALSHRELDISDGAAVGRVTASIGPDVIFNCAVIGVDECETNPEKAEAVNIEGPANLAKAANECGASIVHFSTNYVFDGMRDSDFYTIDDEPRPVNNYGRTKWLGEQAVSTECERSFIIRTSWVYGGGKNSFFDNAIAALRSGKTVEAITDNRANTTYVGDLVERVAGVISHGQPGTYQVVNEGVCAKYDFAVAAASLLGVDAELVVPVSSADTSFIAERPRYTPMRCKLTEEIGLQPLRDWKTALSEFIRL